MEPITPHTWDFSGWWIRTSVFPGVFKRVKLSDLPLYNYHPSRKRRRFTAVVTEWGGGCCNVFPLASWFFCLLKTNKGNQMSVGVLYTNEQTDRCWFNKWCWDYYTFKTKSKATCHPAPPTSDFLQRFQREKKRWQSLNPQCRQMATEAPSKLYPNQRK